MFDHHIDPDELRRLAEEIERLAKRFTYGKSPLEDLTKAFFAYDARPPLLNWADVPVVERDERQAEQRLDGAAE